MSSSQKILNILKYALIVGGVYDFILAIIIFFMYKLLSEIFNEMIPEPLIIFQTLGLFLVFSGILLIIASRSPIELYYIGLISVGIRLIYFLLVIIYYASHTLYLLTSIADLLTGLGMLIPYSIYFLKAKN